MPASLPLLDCEHDDALLIRARCGHPQANDDLLGGAPRGAQRPRGRPPAARPRFSPDRADALAHAAVHVDMPAVDVESHQGDSMTGHLMQKAW